jgi:hypothetical protein
MNACPLDVQGSIGNFSSLRAAGEGITPRSISPGSHAAASTPGTALKQAIAVGGWD